MFENPTTILNLGAFSEEDKERLKGNSPIKRKINDIIKKSRAAAKRDTCFYCGKHVDSFYNSHSVPAFCLRNSSTDAEVLTLNTLVDTPLLETPFCSPF